jgi:Phytanoyl-CoA dioxygenase (PhyH)
MTSATRMLHTYEYEILNEDLKKPRRVIRSIFGSEELQQFTEAGYLVIDGLLGEATVGELRRAVDNLREVRFGESQRSTYRSSSFAGQYLREPHAYDERFWILLDRQPIIDGVRSLLGPRIVMRSFSVRTTFGGTNAGTRWHRDQRSLVSPEPPLFTEPHVVTALIYLDDIDDACGPTFLLPASYRLRNMLAPEDAFAHLPGEVALRPCAGTVAFLHSATWHRGGPNGVGGRCRRLIIQQFAPSWASRSHFEEVPDPPRYASLVEKARAEGDEEMLELLGHGGYM